VRYSWFDRNPAPALYRPYRQAPQPFTYFTLRTTGDPLQLVTAVRKQMTSLDSELPLFEIKTLDRVIYQSVLGLSYVAVMMTVLGVIALVLACVGVYAVMAYGVSERTREIGIRMALGAERGGVLRMVMGRGMLITGIGLLIGFAISFPVARVLSSLSYGVSSSDWQTFAGVSFALAASALTASYIPARRASTIDPMAALRNE
jgi:putative ABC transport system permease protein